MGWTEEEVALLRDLTEQGLAASAIGRRLGKTRNSVIGKWRRLGDQAPRRGRPGPPVWNTEKVEQLRKLWIGGYEVRQIADQMGMSLAAVHGKIHHIRPKHENIFPLREIHRKPKKNLKEKPEPFIGKTVSFRDHHDNQCSYIPGDPNGADTMYCAEKRIDGVSYCLTHFQLCTTAVARRTNRPFLVLAPNVRLELAPE